MTTCVYDKTDKGREEIATRKYHVPPRLRTLLVMIDGKRSSDALITDLNGIGLNQASFDQLLRDDYIRLVALAATPPAPAPAPVQREVAPVPQLETASPREDSVAPADSGERFRSLYDFFNQTIKSTIGLRGIGLQLKVEKCSSVDDFRALRLPYLEAVHKARGRETALSLRDRLDGLLGGAPGIESFQPD